MAKATVLVVDDEESMRYFLTRALKRAGYRVTAVPTGEEALTSLTESEADLVLLDLMLPGMGGMEVLAEIGRRWPGMLVIFMTGYGTVERALEGMRRGASDFVTKPFTGPEIVTKIEEAFGKAGRRRAAAPEEEPAAVTPPVAPSRTLAAYLVEAAQAEGIPLPGETGGDLPFREADRLFETLYFTELIRRTGGNVSLAARIAGISRPSLHRKIHDLEIEVDRFRGE
ncbi:MAG: response regulator [Planctomycetota bacterium]|jgi:DNA-binding NtrC family response regulator